ncbi:MAG: hypothetical protein GY765_16785 [bacterium]|nr:hypothetical protein [bacterium]
MADFSALLYLGWKKLLSRWNLIAWLFFLCATLYFGNRNCLEYKPVYEKIDKFKAIQGKYFSNTPNYEGYSRDGIRSMFIPSPTGIFFKNSVIPGDMTGRIDSVVTLQMYNNLKGKFVSPGRILYKMDFSGIIYLGIILLSIFTGFETLSNKEFLKFLGSIKNSGVMFYKLILSRFLLFSFFVFLLFAAQLFLIILHGIHLTGADLYGILGYFFTTLIMLSFFFLVGVLIATFSFKGMAAVLPMLVAWIILVLFIPGLLNTVVDKEIPDTLTDYQTELDKFSIVSQFEKQVLEKYGRFSKEQIEKFRESTEYYFKVHFPKIRQKEEELSRQFSSAFGMYRWLSIITPTTFYLMTGNEISSKGYLNMTAYHNFKMEMQEKFVRFYIDRTMYHHGVKMVQFRNGDGTVFYSSSHFPDTYWYGIILNLFYILLLLPFCRKKYLQFIHSPDIPKPAREDNLEIKWEKGKVKAMEILRGNRGTAGHLYNLLTVWPDAYNKTIRAGFDDIDLTGNTRRRDFLYLSHPRRTPAELGVKHLAVFLNLLLNLSPEERAKIKLKLPMESKNGKGDNIREIMDKGLVLAAFLPYFKKDVMLVNNITIDLPKEFIFELNEAMREAALNGAAVIFLTTESDMNSIMRRGELHVDISELQGWSSFVSKLKQMDDSV